MKDLQSNLEAKYNSFEWIATHKWLTQLERKNKERGFVPLEDTTYYRTVTPLNSKINKIKYAMSLKDV